MRWLIENHGIKRFAILQLDSAGSRTITQYYEKVCEDLGIETQVIYYPTFTIDFYGPLTKLLAYNPDLLFVGPEALKQARELGYTGLATGTLTAVDVDAVVKATGMDYAEGYWFGTNYSWKVSPETMDFHDKYIAKYGEYDEQALGRVGVIECIIQGIRKAQSVDPADVKLALEKMAEENEPIHLPIGDCYWGGEARYGGLNHQLLTPIHIMDIHNGEERLLEVLPPPSDEELQPLQ
jgi:ABC-type branched-subunit amino acid transport system substrate-binding protein